MVEQELAAREEDLRLLEEEVEHSKAYACALEGEIRSLRGLGPHQRPILGTSAIQTLSLGRLTAGLDNSPGDGDDALQVLLVPEDVEGHAVKVPGTALIQAYQISPEGTKHLLSTWHVNPDQLSSSWRNGLLSTGYSLILPWQHPPQSDKLRVLARLQVADGRTFEADKDIQIRVPAYRKLQVPRMPHADETLPPPHPVDVLPPTPVSPPVGEQPGPTIPVEPVPVAPPVAVPHPPTIPPVEPNPRPTLPFPTPVDPKRGVPTVPELPAPHPALPPGSIVPPMKKELVPPIPTIEQTSPTKIVEASPVVQPKPVGDSRIKVATSSAPVPIAQSRTGRVGPSR